MARVLVVYGTTDGHTAKVAAAIGAALRAQGLGADVFEAGTSPGPGDYDAAIVAASVHAGGYQRSVRRWIRQHREELSGKRSAFVSVCLGVLQRDAAVDAELGKILERFFAATGWRPATTKTVAGALPYRQYNPLKRWLMRRIVAKAAGDVDTSRDYEYTDWQDLRAFVASFVEGLRTPVSPPAGSEAARVA